jgi:hypothetical protein
MRRAMIVLRVIFILFLFGSTAHAEDIGARHVRDIAKCKSALKSGFFERRIDYAHCVNLANARLWIDANKPHFDLMEYAARREMRAAHKLDLGEIRETEYWLMRSQIKSELLTALHQRGALTGAGCYDAGSGVTNCY